MSGVLKPADVAGQIPLANKRCLSCETNDIKGLTEEAAKSLLSQVNVFGSVCEISYGNDVFPS